MSLSESRPLSCCAFIPPLMAAVSKTEVQVFTWDVADILTQVVWKVWKKKDNAIMVSANKPNMHAQSLRKLYI